MSLSVIDMPTDGRWTRSAPTIQVEAGSYPLEGARHLRDAIDELLHTADTDHATWTRLLRSSLVSSRDMYVFTVATLKLFLVDGRGTHEIARADTCHGEVHVHMLNKSGGDSSRDVLRSINQPEGVSNGWEQAVEAIIDDCDELVRRWRSGG